MVIGPLFFKFKFFSEDFIKYLDIRICYETKVIKITRFGYKFGMKSCSALLEKKAKEINL